PNVSGILTLSEAVMQSRRDNAGRRDMMKKHGNAEEEGAKGQRRGSDLSRTPKAPPRAFSFTFFRREVGTALTWTNYGHGLNAQGQMVA
uniref:Uncharacterized protein n=1 Tax=Scleropages formosus TaxID=113540 RepID=A0A8C9V729_SCLFO